jgi:hypothetical protein
MSAAEVRAQARRRPELAYFIVRRRRIRAPHTTTSHDATHHADCVCVRGSLARRCAGVAAQQETSSRRPGDERLVRPSWRRAARTRRPVSPAVPLHSRALLRSRAREVCSPRFHNRVDREPARLRPRPAYPAPKTQVVSLPPCAKTYHAGALESVSIRQDSALHYATVAT